MKKIFNGFKLTTNVIRDFFDFIIWLGKREAAYYQIKPREALFFLTYRCSSRCKMCQMWKRPYDYREMDLTEWKKAVDMLAELKIGLIYLFGGDVLLKKEILFPLAKYIKCKGISCDITSNGNLLTKEIAKELVETGADNIGVSIDAVGERHDNIRGVKGIFERATQGLKEMVRIKGKRAYPSISIYCTVSNLNIDKFDELLPYAIDLGADQLHFEYYGEFSPELIQQSKVADIVANPYYQRQNDSLLLNEKQARYLKTKIDELERKYREKIYLDTDNIDCFRVQDLVKGSCQHERCYISRYHITIDPSGNVLPCLFFQNYHLGNICEMSISKIWENKRHRDFLRAIKNKQVKICQQCILGAQRNPTIPQAIKRKIVDYTKRYKRKYISG
ncbi:MAG: radical SAM protein [Candidatus Omnitrophota bacterium]